MPGDVGLVSKLIDGVFRFFTDENGYAEIKRRRQLSDLKAKAADALKRGDWDAMRLATDELKRLSDAP